MCHQHKTGNCMNTNRMRPDAAYKTKLVSHIRELKFGEHVLENFL